MPGPPRGPSYRIITSSPAFTLPLRIASTAASWLSITTAGPPKLNMHCGMGFALVPSSVRNLKRTGVQYRQLRGKAAIVEVGVLRLRSVDSELRKHFVEALREAARTAST
jgi:hypothetical protein